ncbi:type II toxin-antitoxin system RelE family toxin [Halorubrum vacuolatum]|nr:type II toxin-antitoxin system RelE/ParE family toxin [Halorubrum vacuolatum]
MKETLENLSKTTYRPEFLRQFEELNRETQNKAAQKKTELVEEYRTNPWKHPRVKYIPSQGEIWRLKIGNRGQKIDHRIFFDLNDEGLIFLTIQHRDRAYEKNRPKH